MTAAARQPVPAPRRRPMPYPRVRIARWRLVLRVARHGLFGPGHAVEAGSSALPLPRWIAALAVGSILGFLPWIVYLGLTIPSKVQAQHYDIAWLGFDCAMWTMLAALAFCALRRHAATGPIAAVASMMLVVDAWFDVFTSSAAHGEMSFAIVLALCGELPMAVLCGWAAVHAERIRTRAYRSLHQRWERAVRGAEELSAVAIPRTDVGRPDVG